MPTELAEAKKEVQVCLKLIKNFELEFATIKVLTDHVVNDIDQGTPQNLAAAKALCNTIVGITETYR
jgi:hypothetical protein